MRAAQVVSLQGPSGVEIREVPDVVARAGEVLVRVHSVGIAFPDLLLSKGEYQLKPEVPFTIGIDAAGTVEALGEGVTGFRVGQRVASAMPYGGAAELLAAPAGSVFPLPDQVSFDEGAALGMNYLT